MEKELILHESAFEPATKDRQLHQISRPSLSYWQDAWIRLKKNRQAYISLIIIIFMLLFTLLGPFLWTMNPSHQDLNRISEGPTFSKTAVVLGELDVFEPTIDPRLPESPVSNGLELVAPKEFNIFGVSSTQSVRLKWSHVVGASGYAIYRGETKPDKNQNFGVPLAVIEGGNHLSYEDQFNLENKTYYYTIVAKNAEESKNAKTIKVSLPSTISLDEALQLYPQSKAGIKGGLKVGMTIKLLSHPLGTDYLGRDLLARLMFGARVSLFIGFFAPFLASIIGIFIGGISGFFGGAVDHWLMRIADFVLALPFLLFMILFKVVLGAGAGESGIQALLIAMVILSWTGLARLTRGQLLQLRESEFVQASRLLGAKSFYIILRHLLPNTLGVILVSITFAIPSAIFTEAFLSFIGMGVVPPTPSWGSMCNDGIQTFLTYPHERSR
ncbi:MAG: ABC transporter permease [Deltaproteobacteria bacterium]|nr:ABC transporter permease [Deltaproteobacteria bacterium]